MENISIAIQGITGRMGQAIAKLTLEDNVLRLVGGTSSNNSVYNQQDISSLIANSHIKLKIQPDISFAAQTADVIIDLSHPSLLKKLLITAEALKKPLVIGTTGLTKKDFEEIQKFAKKLPIFYSSNFSIGIAVLKKLIKIASSQLDESFSIDILEKHHQHKKDKPSGTALSLLEEIEKNESEKKNIPIHSIRAANIFGEHSIYFHSQDEKILLYHEAYSRNVFAKGALVAAKFIYNKKPGLYSMDDLTNQEFSLCNR